MKIQIFFSEKYISRHGGLLRVHTWKLASFFCVPTSVLLSYHHLWDVLGRGTSCAKKTRVLLINSLMMGNSESRNHIWSKLKIV